MRKFILVLALAATLSNASHTARAADAVPKFDILRNCKAEMAGGSMTGETQTSCVNAEEQARDELIQTWHQFAKEDKAVCISETSIDGTPSYVEVQTCLEIASDYRARLARRQ